MKYSFFGLLILLLLSSCDFAPNRSSSNSGNTESKEAFHQLYLPILLDAEQVPYNQVSQEGQTWISTNSISWNTYGTKYETPLGLEGIPGISLDYQIEKSFSPQYFCISPKKDDKFVTEVLYTQKNPPLFEPVDLTQIGLSDGTVEGVPKKLTLVQQKNVNIPNPTFSCATNSFGVRDGKGILKKGRIKVSYRIQYPVGTKIGIGTGSNSKEYTIASNYASAGNVSTGVLSISDYLDICFVDNTCKTKSINIRLLSGEVINITNSIEQQRKNRGGSENFLIPADTAELEFLFYQGYR